MDSQSTGRKTRRNSTTADLHLLRLFGGRAMVFSLLLMVPRTYSPALAAFAARGALLNALCLGMTASHGFLSCARSL